jgi:arylformamidase
MAVYLVFDQESLDREYSPSSCVDEINVYLKQYAEKSEAIGKNEPGSIFQLNPCSAYGM